MGERHWIVQQIDGVRRMSLAEALAISPITASVLLARGVTTVEQGRNWLRHDLPGVSDAGLLPDAERALARLHCAVVRREHICFYGDYDVDGITATGIYASYFRSLGAQVSTYIPHRMREGYGLHGEALRRLRQRGVSVVVTSDCGTTSHREADEAIRLGLDLIVTDHHVPEATLPPVHALVNPNRTDSAYPFHGLCSAGLAYTLVRTYEETYRAGGIEPESLLDLVALATVADVVPLHGDNRRLVRAGLPLLTRGARCGIRALKQVAGVERECTTWTISFKLAPRINAAGRMAHADAALRLLTTEDDAEARQLAQQMDEWNRERQRLEEVATADAVAQVHGKPIPDALVVWSADWHVGVVGIVAARLTERFHRPAVVVAVDGRGLGKGSVRSVPGVDVCKALASCRELLDGFGGHPSAAGVTVRASRLPALQEKFAAAVGEAAEQQALIPKLYVDAEVGLHELNPRIVQELEGLHPFGAGNPEPTLVVRNLSVLRTQVVGNKHLRLLVQGRASAPMHGIVFRTGSLEAFGCSADRPVDLAFVPEINRWNGFERVELRIRDLKRSVSA